MDPRNAIEILYQVQASWVANGSDHEKLALAIATLSAMVASTVPQNANETTEDTATTTTTVAE